MEVFVVSVTSTAGVRQTNTFRTEIGARLFIREECVEGDTIVFSRTWLRG